MPSINKTIVTSLIETTQRKVDPPKLFEALRKMNDDLNATYDAVFDGPLPPVSGKQLDLTEVPQEKLPVSVAFEDVVNVFTENQVFEKDVQIGELSIQSPNDFVALLATDMAHDGSTYLGGGAGIVIEHERIVFLKRITGSLFETLTIENDGLLKIGQPSNDTGCSFGDLLFINDRGIRAVNSAGDNTIPVIRLTTDNIVVIGNNGTGGEGNAAIPRADAINLPAAGGNRNGVIIINQTNNRLCYYVNGNRYYLSGTAF